MGEASTRAQRWTRNMGFTLAEEPAYDIPTLPPDITSIEGGDLMILFAEIVSWIDWMEVQLFSAQVDERSADMALEKRQAELMIQSKGEKSVSVGKSLAFSDAEFLELRTTAFTAYSRRKMLETIFNSLDRKKFVVSREITRRKYGE